MDARFSSIKRKALIPSVVCVILLVAVSLSACRYYDTGNRQADSILEELLHAVENQDAASVKALFSVNATQSAGDLDEQISGLFEFYTGEAVDTKRYGPGTYESSGNGSRTKTVIVSYDVSTTEEDYRIAFQFCMIDTDTPENEGLCSVYIVKAENTEADHAYWGDQLWTPGITIVYDAVSE